MRSTPRRLRFQEASGFTILQVVVTVAVIAIVSSFAILTLNSTRASMRLQNSVRQLSSYLEKARLDAVRRHANSSVVFTSPSTYDVTMDFSGSGTVTTRSFPFEDGITVFSTPLPSLTFNWRGRISSCTVTFAVRNAPGEQSNVDVSDAGDVTVNNNVNVLPDANYATVNTNYGVDSAAVVSGSAVHNNTADCTNTESPPPGPPITGEGPGCPDSANPSSISIKKSGGSTAQITVSATNTGTITVSAPINLQVTPTSQAVSGGGSANFSITSLNNTRGTFAVNFNTPCTTLTVLLTVTN
jgi:Tfp pilus assembly protein FimT